eukprot:15440112-Alexandrium_andersonii.AAC.1
MRGRPEPLHRAVVQHRHEHTRALHRPAEHLRPCHDWNDGGAGLGELAQLLLCWVARSTLHKGNVLPRILERHHALTQPNGMSHFAGVAVPRAAALLAPPHTHHASSVDAELSAAAAASARSGSRAELFREGSLLRPWGLDLGSLL